jgi:hypothetical protein
MSTRGAAGVGVALCNHEEPHVNPELAQVVRQIRTEENDMTPNVKKPSTLRTPWPPTDDRLQVQTVSGWDDWWSLQTHFGRCDAWDIIYYNFATYNPEEVNWYLREWIGCHDVSPDGKNYRFGVLPGGLPMQIYIPKNDWLPPGPHQASRL